MADARSLNQVTLIGRIPKDVNFEWTKGEKRTGFCRFQVVTNEIMRGGKSYAEYHNCVAWGPNAELLRDHASIGLLLCIKGRLRHKSFKDKEGNWKNWTQVEAERIIFLGKGADQPVDEEPEEQEEHEQDPY